MLGVDEQLAVIRRGVDQLVPEAELRQKLAAGRPLRVKLGIDPTGFDVHLGHTVALRKLRQFQELGHTAVLIIGTAKVMDVSIAEVVRNGEWFDKFDFGAMIRLLGSMTIQRMLERDDFDKRHK